MWRSPPNTSSAAVANETAPALDAGKIARIKEHRQGIPKHPLLRSLEWRDATSREWRGQRLQNGQSRASDKRAEFAPPHSITSSARDRIDGGVGTPNALAGLRLVTQSNGVRGTTRTFVPSAH